jgi:hypothetical protein
MDIVNQIWNFAYKMYLIVRILEYNSISLLNPDFDVEGRIYKNIKKKLKTKLLISKEEFICEHQEAFGKIRCKVDPESIYQKMQKKCIGISNGSVDFSRIALYIYFDYTFKLTRYFNKQKKEFNGTWELTDSDDVLIEMNKTRYDLSELLGHPYFLEDKPSYFVD